MLEVWHIKVMGSLNAEVNSSAIIFPVNKVADSRTFTIVVDMEEFRIFSHAKDMTTILQNMVS